MDMLYTKSPIFTVPIKDKWSANGVSGPDQDILLQLEQTVA